MGNYRGRPPKTTIMSLSAFNEGLHAIADPRRKAFLGVLFWSGCRISEAIALRGQDVNLDPNGTTIYLNIFHAKGTRQTEPFPAPFVPYFQPLLTVPVNQPLFDFSIRTGRRIVAKAFPQYYPHFFRLNRISTLLLRGATILDIRALIGITTPTIEHYSAHVSVLRSAEILQSEARNY